MGEAEATDRVRSALERCEYVVRTIRWSRVSGWRQLNVEMERDGHVYGGQYLGATRGRIVKRQIEPTYMKAVRPHV